MESKIKEFFFCDGTSQLCSNRATRRFFAEDRGSWVTCDDCTQEIRDFFHTYDFRYIRELDLSEIDETAAGHFGGPTLSWNQLLRTFLRPNCEVCSIALWYCGSKQDLAKILRKETHLTLPETLNLINSAPVVILESIPKSDLERLLADIRATGSQVSVRY